MTRHALKHLCTHTHAMWILNCFTNQFNFNRLNCCQKFISPNARFFFSISNFPTKREQINSCVKLIKQQHSSFLFFMPSAGSALLLVRYITLENMKTFSTFSCHAAQSTLRCTKNCTALDSRSFLLYLFLLLCSYRLT